MVWSRDPLARPEQLIRRVYSYAAYRLGDGPEAEDVTNETFARALRYRKTYDRSKGEPIAWLLGIARHCVDAALASKQETSGDMPEGSDDGFERRAIERLTLASALDRLSNRDRELIALRYGADLTASQIAVRLEMTTNAVEVALHRALDRLRAHVDDPVIRRTSNSRVVRVSAINGIPVVDTHSAPNRETA
jgi:RNA polymerase sigma-70 factor (ECF subfamily)